MSKKHLEQAASEVSPATAATSTASPSAQNDSATTSTLTPLERLRTESHQLEDHAVGQQVSSMQFKLKEKEKRDAGRHEEVLSSIQKLHDLLAAKETSSRAQTEEGPSVHDKQSMQLLHPHTHGHKHSHNLTLLRDDVVAHGGSTAPLADKDKVLIAVTTTLDGAHVHVRLSGTSEAAASVSLDVLLRALHVATQHIGKSGDTPADVARSFTHERVHQAWAGQESGGNALPKDALPTRSSQVTASPSKDANRPAKRSRRVGSATSGPGRKKAPSKRRVTADGICSGLPAIADSPQPKGSPDLTGRASQEGMRDTDPFSVNMPSSYRSAPIGAYDDGAFYFTEDGPHVACGPSSASQAVSASSFPQLSMSASSLHNSTIFGRTPVSQQIAEGLRQALIKQRYSSMDPANRERFMMQLVLTQQHVAYQQAEHQQVRVAALQNSIEEANRTAEMYRQMADEATRSAQVGELTHREEYQRLLDHCCERSRAVRLLSVAPGTESPICFVPAREKGYTERMYVEAQGYICQLQERLEILSTLPINFSATSTSTATAAQGQLQNPVGPWAESDELGSQPAAPDEQLVVPPQQQQQQQPQSPEDRQSQPDDQPGEGEGEGEEEASPDSEKQIPLSPSPSPLLMKECAGKEGKAGGQMEMEMEVEVRSEKSVQEQEMQETRERKASTGIVGSAEKRKQKEVTAQAVGVGVGGDVFDDVF